MKRININEFFMKAGNRILSPYLLQNNMDNKIFVYVDSKVWTYLNGIIYRNITLNIVI